MARVFKVHELDRTKGVGGNHFVTLCGIECWPTKMDGEADTITCQRVEYASPATGSKATCQKCIRVAKSRRK